MQLNIKGLKYLQFLVTLKLYTIIFIHHVHKLEYN